MSKNYRPSESETFMNPKQVEYFKNKILRLRQQILEALAYIEEHGTRPVAHAGDVVDQANDVFDSTTTALICEREQETLNDLEKALARIENGTYGYCAVTGNPINLARLDARPTATLSIEAQESAERQHRFTRSIAN
ncbi:MAG: TraR/DksA family transcriptional regulator [Alphaproteobacteria bacterium]|nr:TraR/DksA family transcriptional regulator [Alphaproteobacteria bacterium]